MWKSLWKMQFYTAFEQGFEQVHIWIRLIKILKRFVKRTEYLNGTDIKGC